MFHTRKKTNLIMVCFVCEHLDVTRFNGNESKLNSKEPEKLCLIPLWRVCVSRVFLICIDFDSVGTSFCSHKIIVIIIIITIIITIIIIIIIITELDD